MTHPVTATYKQKHVETSTATRHKQLRAHGKINFELVALIMAHTATKTQEWAKGATAAHTKTIETHLVNSAMLGLMLVRPSLVTVSEVTVVY